MDESPEKFGEAIKAIKKCYWRRSLGGVYICSGACSLCDEVISKGECDTLIKLFEQMRKEKLNDNEKRSNDKHKA